MHLIELPFEIILYILEFSSEPNIISTCKFFHQIYQENIYNIHLDLAKLKLQTVSFNEISYQGLKLLFANEQELLENNNLITKKNHTTLNDVDLINLSDDSYIFIKPIKFGDLDLLDKIIDIYCKWSEKNPYDKPLKWSFFNAMYTSLHYEYDILLLACYYNNIFLINKYLTTNPEWKYNNNFMNLIFKNDNLEFVLKNQNLGLTRVDLINMAITYQSHKIIKYFCPLLTINEKKNLIDQVVKEFDVPIYKQLLNDNNFTKCICQQKCSSPYFKNKVLIITDIVFSVKGTKLLNILQKKVSMEYNKINKKFTIIIYQNEKSLKYIPEYKFSKGKYKDHGTLL